MSQNVYSTTEQIVGTWIDGKQIYRKVITLNIQSSNFSSQTFNTGLTDVNEILPLTSSIVHVPGYDILPGYGNDLGYRMEFSSNATKFTITKQGAQSWLTNGTIGITAYYTKTTN